MNENKGLHFLYKRLGETPNQTILRFKNENPDYKNEPMTYAGRLDPMAEGLLLVLSHDELSHKDKYLDLPKTYIAEILWGFETDTLDVLGIVSENSLSSSIPVYDSTNFLQKFIGKFEQVYPNFSSKPILGRPLFEWAREGSISQIEIPKHEVEIFEIKYISRRVILGSQLLQDIKLKVESVSGDFRQKEILEKWEDVLKDKRDLEFSIDKIEMKVSSGFYVRQFISDLAKSFGTSALTFHIKRTRVGDVKVEDCL